MPDPRAIPALADVTQDIAGPLPVDFLISWAAGRHDMASAQDLLQRFKLEGSVVSSDSSGLSKISQEMDLLEVLSMISRPKELIHAMGSAIGGRAVGRWVADNTLMFYPPSISPESILLAMNEVQLHIARNNPVQVGMCLHCGVFYEIGQGLYGQQSDLVEELAEHHAGPGEILLTADAAARLAGDTACGLTARTDLKDAGGREVFKLTSAPSSAGPTPGSEIYPHAYTEDFFDLLRKVRDPAQSEAARKEIYSHYLFDRTIIFISRQQETRGQEVPAMLGRLVGHAVMDAIVRAAVASDWLIRSAGGLAILAVPDPGDALACTLELRDRFRENDLTARMGMDRGSVLIFRSAACSDVVGNPVNVASKISEDVGQPGRVSLTTRVAESVECPPGLEEFQVRISKITISGFLL